MRCLNCGTVVANSDRSCRSCGSECITPVSKQGAPPIPLLAGIGLFVGMFGYPLTIRPDHPIHDREIIEHHKMMANVWGLVGAFVGAAIDGLIWSRRRQQRDGGTPSSHFGPNLNDAFRRPETRIPGQVQLQTQGLAAPASANLPQRQPVRAVGQWEDPSQQRSTLARVFFGAMWAVVFFIVAAIVSSSIATSGAGGDPALSKRLGEEAARKYGLATFVGSIVLAIVLTKFGVLPGTRRVKR